nr:MAG TPA: hypothetical protein [Caudoviricetes sp.]
MYLLIFCIGSTNLSVFYLSVVVGYAPHLFYFLY